MTKFQSIIAAFLLTPFAYGGDALEVNWVTDKPASNHSQFVTTANVPAGAMVKIRVGKVSSVFLRVASHTFRQSDPGQILKYKVERTGRVSIDISSQNRWEDVVSAKKGEDGTWTLTWKDSSIEVKIIPDDF